MNRLELVEYLQTRQIHWLGHDDDQTDLRSNPYLLIDEGPSGREAVLIDPGSALHAEWLVQELLSLIEPHELRYVVLQHQDPDICAAVPRLAEEFTGFILVAHWRAAVLVKHYGITQPFIYPEQQDNRLTLGSGRRLQFLHVPYAHSPSSLMTYDESSQVLFSGDLFGAFTREQGPLAEEHYLEAMALFHENYIPSNEILRLAMARVRSLQHGPGLQLILPQHGLFLGGEMIERAVSHLEQLECGDYLLPVRQELHGGPGAYMEVLSEVYKLAVGVFGQRGWQEALQAAGWPQQPDLAHASAEGLDKLLQISFQLGGYTVIEVWRNRLMRLLNAYQLPLPLVYADASFRSGQDQLTDALRLVDEMGSRLDKAEELNRQLKHSLTAIAKTVETDQLTGLGSDTLLPGFLEEAIRRVQSREAIELTVALIGVDDMAGINHQHGTVVGDRLMRQVANELMAVFPEEGLFRYRGAAMVAVFPGLPARNMFLQLDSWRQRVREMNLQRVSATVSIAVLGLTAGQAGQASSNQLLERLAQALSKVQQVGGNRVETCDELRSSAQAAAVLVVEPNPVAARLLSGVARGLGYRVYLASDGLEAVEQLQQHQFALVLSELMLPKRNGMFLLEYLQQYSTMHDTPVVFVTSLVEPEQELLALQAGAADYLSKPVHPEVLKVRIQRAVDSQVIR